MRILLLFALQSVLIVDTILYLSISMQYFVFSVSRLC